MILAMAVLIQAAEHALGKLLDAEYGGIASDGDYEYLVSSLGYAGYDSLITEKVWQEFMAYEYAVLMDVAEFLYEGQEKYYSDLANMKDAYGPYSEYFYSNEAKNEALNGGKRGEGEPTTDKLADGRETIGPAYMPYLMVVGEYDLSKMTEEDWEYSTIEGQGSARFGVRNVADLPSKPTGIGDGIVTYGGNRDVMSPTITYEYKTNPYEPEADGSLVPYITVLKEDLVYNYYTVGGRDVFKNDTRKNESNSGLVIDYDNIDLVNLMEINYKLNAGNGYLPKSKAIATQMLLDSTLDPTSGVEAWPVADSEFEQQLYYTNAYGSITYKTPLEIIINRYLPKASILTAWYYVKDTDLADPETQGKESANTNNDERRFDIDGLMRDIKAIYNYYCWKGPDEEYDDEEIEAIVYDSGDGTVVRENGQGTPAKRYSTTQKVATTNKDTFIHFGQAGLETNKFEIYELYDPSLGGSKLKAPETITGDPEEATVPVVTDLLSKDAYFLDKFGLDTTYEYTYNYRYKVSIPPKTVTVEAVEGIRIDTIKVLKSCGHGIGISTVNKNSFSSCSSCSGRYSGYHGALILNRGGYTTSNGDTVYVVQDLSSHMGAINKETKSVVVEPGGESDWKYDTSTATAGALIPYDVTNGGGPRGLSGIDETNEMLKYIHENVVKNAEKTLVEENEDLKQAAEYTIECQEKEFANYEYLYPTSTTTPAGGPSDAVAAAVLSGVFIDYKHEIPFYNFSVFSSSEEAKSLFNNEILDAAKLLSGTSTTGNTEFFELFSSFISTPEPQPARPSGVTKYEFLGIESIDELTVNGFSDDSTYNTPSYTAVKSQASPYNAIYDIDDYQIALTLDIAQKRMSTMIVTNVETWAKSASYTVYIVQNSFDYTNYRYVVPHSYFSFGVYVFRIDERPLYRVEYYKEYFSKYENEISGIKEADVLVMMMKWEEFAKSGNDTAYAFMRDLYKLIMYIRQKGIDKNDKEEYILPTAYSYMYVPDTIWEFREGVSQEAFWTERLAANMAGDDALTAEELNKVLVKKEEIAWQILDYDEYAECKYMKNGEEKAKVYALFPFGVPYTRTWYMEEALRDGIFNDGGYRDGHSGADWTSRKKMTEMLSENPTGLAKEIYDYELRSRTLRNIMNGYGDYEDRIERALEYIGGGDAGSAYTRAETELRAELREYEIRSPEVAVAGGIVYKADYNCYSGFSAGVWHTNDGVETEAFTSYVHMRRWPVVQTGDIVGPGTILGYEGTTGNSGGNHLHQNVNVAGIYDSPAEFMGPIFAPFYNQEKVYEITQELAEYSSNQELLLGTDYYTLIRTVLMQEFDASGKAKYSGIITPDEQAIYLKTGVFIYLSGDDGETYRYIDFNEQEPGVGTVISGDRAIVKVGINPAEYYLCEYEVELVKPNPSGSGHLSSSGEYLSSNNSTRLKVLNAEKLDVFSEEVLNNSVRVKTEMEDVYGTTVIVWGNNVPYAPIIKDMNDAIDITSLDMEKTFDPTEEKYKREYSEDSSDPPKMEGGYEDVKATKDFFDPIKARAKIKIPGWLLLYLSDIESPYSVPFYEGPVSVQHQNSGIQLGYPGSVSGDLLKLQQAIIMLGLDSRNKYGERRIR